jgi:preprotein translocase subunit SecF
MSKDLEKRVAAIENRNKKVELDKAWETSLLRRSLIATLTYIVVVLFMLSANIEKPFVTALVPTIGFLLSTMTVAFIKDRWLKR